MSWSVCPVLALTDSRCTKTLVDKSRSRRRGNLEWSKRHRLCSISAKVAAIVPQSSCLYESERGQVMDARLGTDSYR